MLTKPVTSSGMFTGTERRPERRLTCVSQLESAALPPHSLFTSDR
jgi:hypothetical protein